VLAAYAKVPLFVVEIFAERMAGSSARGEIDTGLFRRRRAHPARAMSAAVAEGSR